MRVLLLLASHALIGLLGFALGIYLLPILTESPPPDGVAMRAVMDSADYSAEVRRDLPGSDALHWGEGRLYLSEKAIAFAGRLAPGPDYKLYLSPGPVGNEEDFQRLRPRLRRVADITGFSGFLVHLPSDLRLADYSSAVVWCESFGAFITSAVYRP